MNRIYVFKIDSEVDLKTLPKMVLAHCQEYKDEKKFKQSTFAWKKLQEVLKNDYEYELNEITFNEYGKPFLKDNPLYFSLSHTDEVVAIIISEQACGVDIQKEFINLKVSEKLLNSEENEQFEDIPQAKEYLNVKWVLKESYAKKIGTGLTKEVFESNVYSDNVINLTYKDETYYLGWDCDGFVGIKNNLD